jgi:hypothetical protein
LEGDGIEGLARTVGRSVCAGEAEKGLAQIAQGLKGANVHMQLARQANAQLEVNRHEAALASATAGLKVVEKMGGAPLEAELWRLKGEALLADAGTVTEAEVAMEKGIYVARQQNANSWELRGATSLARLWQQQGRHEEAAALLAPVYGLVQGRIRYHRLADSSRAAR